MRSALLRDTAARHAAGRFVGWVFEALGAPPPGLPAGRGVDPRGVDDRPVAVVLLLEAEPDAVARTAEDLARVAAAGGPRSLLVLDRPHFAVARRAGIAADHVLSHEAWAKRHPDLPWEDYLAGELRRLRHDFATDVVVTLPAEGSAALDPAALEALLRPARRRTPVGRVWRRMVVRLERRVDRGTV